MSSRIHRSGSIDLRQLGEAESEVKHTTLCLHSNLVDDPFAGYGQEKSYVRCIMVTIFISPCHLGSLVHFQVEKEEGWGRDNRSLH
jgi:hypothetical protein